MHGHKYVSDVMHTYRISIPPALWYLVDRSDSAAVVSYDFFVFITQPGLAPRFLAQKAECRAGHYLTLLLRVTVYALIGPGAPQHFALD